MKYLFPFYHCIFIVISSCSSSSNQSGDTHKGGRDTIVRSKTIADVKRLFNNNVLLAQHIETDEGESHAGTGWCLRIEDKQYLVTALHIFGPSGGFTNDIPSTKLREKVKFVELSDYYSGDVLARVSNGEVMGINIGGGAENGKVIGIGNPAVSCCQIKSKLLHFNEDD